MKKSIILLIAIGLCFEFTGKAMAGASATATATYEVTAINELSASGNPGSLTVTAATAGSQPDAVTDATTTYAITTNGTNKKITAAINTAMPAGTTLKVTLAAPTGASSSQVTLSTTPADAVTGITTLAESGKTITYELSATVAAGVVASGSKTVTYTIVDGV